MGIHCPIKNQCLRYTRGVEAVITDGTTAKFFRRCTNQKKFIQDEAKVVKGR
jgi:hypothetical protein